MDSTAWLESLNKQQREAVAHPPAPLLVLAGPGSGKTRILTNRIVWLIGVEKALPERILAVTFTNRAAEEMRERLFQALGDEAERVWVYTFHAAAARILRRFGTRIGIDPNFAIVDEDEQRHAINRLVRRTGFSREQYPISDIVGYISRQKNALLDPAQAGVDSDPALVELARVYEAWLHERQSLDFDDLIRYAVALLRQSKEVREHFQRTLKHVLVDEYQDINRAQYELLKLLAPIGSSVTIVADDDQSIYGWRGSQPILIDDFIERYQAHVVKLEISYRCPPAILYGAQRLITRQRSQERQRFMRSERGGDASIFHYIFHDIQQEQRWLITLIGKLISERGYRPRDIGILYRTHRLAAPIEQALVQAGYRVHRLRKESFFDEPIVRDIVRYIQLVRLRTPENFTAAINFPRRQIDELTMVHLRQLAESESINILELARRCHESTEISPLTQATLRGYLDLIDEGLPDASEPADEALETIFQRIETLQSPWREDDIPSLDGFMQFLDPQVEVGALADAIDAGQDFRLLHPRTLDGYAAAAILQHALQAYFAISVTTQPDTGIIPSSPENTVVIQIHDDQDRDPVGKDGDRIHLRLPAPLQGAYTLTTYVWRCAQALLMAYEGLADRRYIVYDVETTGTKVHRDELVEIGALAYEDQAPADEGYHSYVRPQRGYIPRSATRVHGITYEQVAGAPLAADVVPDFLRYIGQDILVGHNIARFDNRFIDQVHAQLTEGKGFHPYYLDTLRLARRLLPHLRSYSLENLLREMALGEQVSHRAEDDLRQTADLFFALADAIAMEKEREALAETLPLVAMATLAGEVEMVEENRILVRGARRVQEHVRADALANTWLQTLPSDLRDKAEEGMAQLADFDLPATTLDETWEDIKIQFRTHVEAFTRYSLDKSLSAFLDYQALLTSMDTFAHMREEDEITMMTLHNAKGTEFPVVIIIGVEQDNLPLWRTLKDPDQLAEERRVLYVGITRAQEACYLFSTHNRGDGFVRSPSRFAFEIPSEYIRRFRVDARNRVEEL